MAGEDTVSEKETEKFSVTRFLSEVRAEMRKVSWPGRRELASNTAVVFVAVIFVCFLIWIYDAVFNRILEIILS